MARGKKAAWRRIKKARLLRARKGSLLVRSGGKKRGDRLKEQTAAAGIVKTGKGDFDGGEVGSDRKKRMLKIPNGG